MNYMSHSILPPLPPISSVMKSWEMEEDNDYLKYLYPKVSKDISEFVEEECDKMEFEGSMMFDAYPDKTSLQILARQIFRLFRKKYPDAYPDQDDLLLDMIEVILFHEMIHRRNRYRNHQRLYF